MPCTGPSQAGTTMPCPMAPCQSATHDAQGTTIAQHKVAADYMPRFLSPRESISFYVDFTTLSNPVCQHTDRSALHLQGDQLAIRTPVPTRWSRASAAATNVCAAGKSRVRHSVQAPGASLAAIIERPEKWPQGQVNLASVAAVLLIAAIPVAHEARRAGLGKSRQGRWWR
jgi:hypothetical protein